MINSFPFGGLRVYQEAKNLVIDIYALLENFPHQERYILSSQLQRAITSVTYNIAEGSGRRSYKEKIHFIEIAYGSLMESYSQLEIAYELNYITHDNLNNLTPKFITVSRMLNALVKSFEEKIK